jgi:hypothetical protein
MGQGIEPMQIALELKDAVPATVATTAISFPVWFDWIDAAWQPTVAVLGMAVLVLTIYTKILDIRLKQRELKEADE